MFFTILLAYSPAFTHPDLSEESVEFYNGFSPKKISGENVKTIRKGTIEEDLEPRWINHFYDPTTGEGWTGERWGPYDKESIQKTVFNLVSVSQKPMPSKKWAESSFDQLKFSLYGGDHSWQKAVHDFAQGREKEGLESLGHILHLIQDATVPDHTRNDSHPHVAGDPGSPYEEWVEKHTNSRNLQTAEELIKNKVSAPVFSSVGEAFEYTAKYSNENFFSEETIGDDKYKNPLVVEVEQIDKNVSNLIGFIDGKKISLAIKTRKKGSDNFDYEYTINDPKILSQYFDFLSKRAVLAGAGVIDLFFREVEKVKKDKEAVAPPVVLNRLETFTQSILSPVGEAFRINRAYAKAKEMAQSASNKIGETVSKVLRVSGIKPQTASVLSPILSQNIVVPKNPVLLPKVSLPQKTIGDDNPLPVEEILNVPKPPDILPPSNKDKPPNPPSYFPGFGGGAPVSLDDSETEIQAEAEESPKTLVINEIAWNGTLSDPDGYWLELYNYGENEISLDEWSLVSSSSTLNIPLSGTIGAGNYYVIEWSSDDTILNLPADFITNEDFSLADISEESLVLKYREEVVDKTPPRNESWANPGFIGGVERIDYEFSGEDENNWAQADPFFSSLEDSGNSSVEGTPGGRNGRNMMVNAGREISSAVVLKSSRSPFYIIAPQNIIASGSLQIEPGVTLYFSDPDSSTCACLFAYGLVSIGEIGGEVVTIKPAEAPFFSQIRAGGFIFYSGSEGSSIKNAEIKNLKAGIETEAVNLSLEDVEAQNWRDGLSVYSGGSLSVSDSSFKDFLRDGIALYASSSLNAINSTFSGFLFGDAIGAYNNSLVSLEGVTVSSGDSLGVYSGRANILNSIFSGGLSNGISFYSSPSVVLDNVSVFGFDGAGASFYSSSADVSDSRFYDNEIGLDYYGSSLALENNSFYGNSDYGLYNGTSENLDAQNSWWGDLSGPYHSGLNPDGLGDEVYDDTDFSYWALDENFSVFSNTATVTPITDSVSPSVDNFAVLNCNYTLRTDGGCLITQNTATLSWSSTSTDISYYEIVDTLPSETILATTTSFSANINLIEGAHNLLIRAVDTSNNHGSSSPTAVEYRALPIVINEIAWAGTGATTTSDEWIAPQKLGLFA